MIWKEPQKLSLQEMYAVAQTYGTGSKEYNEVFETAVRLFPDDEAANLNAANSAMQRNELDRAENYLKRAGDSGEALVARGILAYMKNDLEKAESYFRQAQQRGVKEADSNLDSLLRVKANKY